MSAWLLLVMVPKTFNKFQKLLTIEAILARSQDNSGPAGLPSGMDPNTLKKLNYARELQQQVINVRLTSI